MTEETQTYPYVSPGPMKLPPGSLEPVEEHPGDSEYEDDVSQDLDACSEIPLSDLEDNGDEGDGGELRGHDTVFEKIKESLSKTQRSDSVESAITSVSDSSDGPHVQISEHYTSVPYGIQPRATYEHSSIHGDIMGVAYNNRMRQFVILDSKGMTTWKRDQVDPRDIKMLQSKDLTPKTFKLNTATFVRRALQYPKYEYRLIVNIVYAPKYNCYFALGKDFSLKVLNRDFEETCSVDSDLRSVLYMLFNPVKDELITGGVGGIKFWQFEQKAGQSFQELKPLANYKLEFLYALPNVGGSWVKRVDLDHYLQHLYCCSDTDLHVYDLSGKLLFKFERAHTMSITGCCFSPSAKVLVTSSVDSEVKVWSLTGGLVHTFRGHSRAVTSLLLHPDTSSILLTSSLDGSFRMWSLDTMDQLYMLVVSTDGVLWMGLTDDKALYISTCRNITLWNLNNFYSFWGMARNQVSKLSLASCEDKTTRVVAVGEDSSVRIFCRSNQKNITTVLPPPDISALQSVLSVCYSREKNAAFLLVTNKEIWVYTTRTDPACRIAVWDVHELQLPYINGDTSNLPPGVIIQPPSTTMGAHRATENGHGNEVVCNCHSLCILNSTAMMMTDEGLCCPIRDTYLLMGLEDGRILFMDPVIRGQKYMEFKACKDAIQDMRHDVPNACLITQCMLKELVIIQIWGLPTLDALYEVYVAPDITCYARLGMSFLSGHKSGHLNFHFLEPIEDAGVYTNAKQEPSAEDIVDIVRRPEHSSNIVAMDTSANLRIFVTCSFDGAIKVWDENKFLMTEVMLEESLSAACFLNDMGDLLVGFKNHIFYIDNGRLCPQLKPDIVEMETSDQESEVYEDPRVLYELLEENPEPITKESYLVPYPNIEFDKDFLEGITKIEQHKAAISEEESGTESESDVSLAPSSIYRSPPESPDSLSRIDLTLGSEYSKYDLRQQMKNTLEYIFKRELEEKKWEKIPASRRWLELRRRQKLAKAFRDPSRKREKIVTIETAGQSDHEADMEVENFSLPTFGDSPGPSPSVTPPTRPSSPRQINVKTKKSEVSDIVILSDEEKEEPAQESTFVPVEPEVVTPQQEMSTLGVYPEGESQSRRYGIKGKVDVKGLMKKRRVTSGRAPSLTRRSSADHAHDDHDHDHGHDDNRALPRKPLQKKQLQLQDRKMPPHLDRNKLLELPPNPPSMLTRKNSLPRDRKNLEIQLLHHPDYHREPKDPSHEHDLANIKYEADHVDIEKAQEEMWKAEASLHGTQLTLPPQRDPNKARLSDGPIKEPRNIRNRNRTPIFGDQGVVDTHMLGVGATPTAELEDDREDDGKNLGDKLKIEIPTGDTKSTGTGSDLVETAEQVTNLDAETLETQMQREKRLGPKAKVTNETFQDAEGDKKGVPKAYVRKSKLNIYLPQADPETLSAKSSYRGTPDSGIDDFHSLSGAQAPAALSKRSDILEQEADDLLQQELAAKKNESLLTEDDKAQAIRRPASSFTGLRRGQLEGERLKAERPRTAHVRFKAEDLQAAFEEALENYRNLPGTPKVVSAENLYKNDGNSFEDNWQERVIERHILLRMKREIRAQSAAKRREAWEITQQEKRNQQYSRSCDSAVGFSQSESSISAVKRANTSMSMPLCLGRSSAPPPTRDKQRPKTAHPTIQKQPQPSKSELSQEKAFRYRLSQDPPFSARSSSSSRSSAPSVQDFSPHWIDPRNPDAWRPKSSRSIPSKCQRYVLISKQKDVTQAPVPSPLEEQLLIERFPKMGARVLQTMPEPVPKVKKSYSMEYSPFVYQRFV